MKIGCIGQGFVGKNISDNFEQRGFDVVRYSLEPDYVDNAQEINSCDVVYVAVPTPTTPEGFQYDIITKVIPLVADGAIVVIKSTVLPGTTISLQEEFPRKIILFSPEFLCEATAAYDVANPILNVIGVSEDTTEQKNAATEIMMTLPVCEHTFVVSSTSAELFKYAHNLNGYFRVILANLLFDVAETFTTDWAELKTMMDSDVMMSPFYNSPVHKDGRGAGGNCFIKDMSAFRFLYEAVLVEDKNSIAVLKALERKNLELLSQTNKSQDIVKEVYGKNIDAL